MKKTATNLLATAAFLFSMSAMAEGTSPYSFSHSLNETVPSIVLPVYDFTQDIIDAEAFQKAGNYPRFAKHFDINVTMLNAGVWSELPNGDHVWRLTVKSPNALATDLFFDNFYIAPGASLNVYTPDHSQVSQTYTYEDNQGNELFSTEFLGGEEQTVEYYEPASVRGQGKLRVTQIAHQYRVLPMADPCEVNVICSPEGDNWQDEKRGVVRIYVVEPAGAGYCTGTLINNTALDCKRYILTAFHCGVNSTTTNFTAWKFYFNYEATTCGGGDAGSTANVMTGCTKKADSNDGGGNTGSDFLLVQMTSVAAPSWWANVYWNGWDKSNTAPVAGTECIHHPAGTNKKLSVTTGTSTSTTWGGSVANTHWRVYWGATANGHGVTEGGSSGSAIFNANSRIIGTLTGGGSYCTATGSPDSYGKMSYHWQSNGTTAAYRLKDWLDPGNTGVTFLDGGYSPCTSTGINDAAAESMFSVYPNPNNGSFTVNVKLENQSDIIIRVMNVLGQEVSSKMISNSMGGTFNMDIATETNGIYFVEIKANGSTLVKKINVLK